MKKDLFHLGLKTKSNEITDKGIVTIAVNGLEIEDSQGDISAKGSFSKTLKENFENIFHYKNHNTNEMIGMPLRGWEDGKHLIFESQLLMEKQSGLDVYHEYKMASELGKKMQHSIGVVDIQRDPINKKRVLEWYLGEFSTLSKLGANQETGLVSIKSLEASGYTPEEVILFFKEKMKLKYKDEVLKNIEFYVEKIEKAMKNKEMLLVQCPFCGLIFDYNSVKEESLNSQVIEAVQMYARWTVDDVVREEMQKLKPEIREQVLNIIGTNKSLEEITTYDYCPKCYAKVSKSAAIKTDTFEQTETQEETIETEKNKNTVEPSADTQKNDSRQKDTITIKSIGNFLGSKE